MLCGPVRLIWSATSRPTQTVRILLERIAAIPGVEKVGASRLSVVGEPYCNVLALLTRADLVRSKEQRQDLTSIGNTAQSGILRLTKGEPIKLNLKAPDFNSFIYVDYFSSDGTVHHLVPGRNYGRDAFPAGKRFGIGHPGDLGPPIRVAPPFGLDMMVALGSSERLFDDLRPPDEDASTYLKDVAAAIDSVRKVHPDAALEYAYYLIFTSDTPSQ